MLDEKYLIPEGYEEGIPSKADGMYTADENKILAQIKLNKPRYNWDAIHAATETDLPNKADLLAYKEYLMNFIDNPQAGDINWMEKVIPNWV